MVQNWSLKAFSIGIGFPIQVQIPSPAHTAGPNPSMPTKAKTFLVMGSCLNEGPV